MKRGREVDTGWRDYSHSTRGWVHVCSLCIYVWKIGPAHCTTSHFFVIIVWTHIKKERELCAGRNHYLLLLLPEAADHTKSCQRVVVESEPFRNLAGEWESRCWGDCEGWRRGSVIRLILFSLYLKRRENQSLDVMISPPLPWCACWGEKWDGQGSRRELETDSVFCVSWVPRLDWNHLLLSYSPCCWK